MKSHTQWIAAVDERHAHIYECRPMPQSGWHVEHRQSLENSWENYHEHHRPSALGRGPTANASQHFASTDRDPDEEHRRFARDVAKWLASQCQTLGIGHVDVFAAPRFLGVLRNSIDQAKIPAELRQAELTRLAPADLAIHPAILSVLQTQIASR